MSETNQERPEASEILKAATCLSINIGGALTGVAKAINRLADVYLYCNDPEGDEAEQPQAGRTLPDGFKGMR